MTHRVRSPRAVQFAGAAFCCVWALSVFLFPLYKGMLVGYVPVVGGVLLAGAILLSRSRRRLRQAVMRPSTGRFLSTVVATGLALRLGVILLYPVTVGSDSATYDALARGILSGEGYGRTAFLPPGYPALLAGWYAVTVAHPVSGYVLGVLFATASIPLIYDVGRRGISPEAGRWSALLLAALPTLVFTSPRVHTTPVLVLAVLVILELTLLIEPGRREWALVAVLGGLLGLASLVRPTFLLAPVGLLIAWWVQTDRSTALVRTAVATAAMVCVVAPWTVRNYHVLGAFVPVSTNGGYVLYNGMNPETDGMWARRAPLPGEHDEVSRNRIRSRAALGWMVDHPGQFALLAARKQLPMWGTSSTSIGVSLSDRVPRRYHGLVEDGIKLTINLGYAMLLGLVAWSTWKRPVWRNAALLPGFLFVFGLFAMHVFFEVMSRYHIPALPVLILVAAAGVSAEVEPASAREGAGASHYVTDASSPSSAWA